MDIIFDIDSTLADPTHRLHFIKDPAYWKSKKLGAPPTPDWDRFLSSEEIAKDIPIPEMWELLADLSHMHRILFITGRPNRQREVTYKWLTDSSCSIRHRANSVWSSRLKWPGLYMRQDDDRRPSHEVKRDILDAVRRDGYNPTLAFDDRAQDAAMWRSEGLLCCQVADGQY